MTAALIVVPACTINNKLSELKDHEILVESKTGSIQYLHNLAKDNVPVAIGRLSQEYYDGVNLKRDDEKAFYQMERKTLSLRSEI